MFIKKYRRQAKIMLLFFLLLFLTGGGEAQKIKQQQVPAVTYVADLVDVWVPVIQL